MEFECHIPLIVAFPALVHLLKIALTISVSTTKCERTFSALKRIKTYLRSSMSEERLNDMAILAIEQDLTDNLKLDNIVYCYCMNLPKQIEE